MFFQNDINELTNVFSDPLYEWGVKTTETHYLWSRNLRLAGPITIPALGEEHARALLRGNITAIKELLDPKQQPWSSASETVPATPRATVFEENVSSVQNGIIAGVLDECCSRSQLADFSLLHKTARGYLFGQGAGCAPGLLSHIYDRYVEPLLSDGNLKYLCDRVLPHSFLVASIVRGNLPTTAFQLAGYTMTRGLMQMVLPSASK